MNILRNLILILIVICLSGCISNPKKFSPATTNVVFQENDKRFSGTQKDFIQEVIHHSEKEIRKLLPKLPDSIKVIVENVDWDLTAIGGVTGRTETNSPPVVMIQISNNYQNGVIDSIYEGLKATTFHEFHHLFRGWTIRDNKFGPGIPNAMVNEGLLHFQKSIRESYMKTMPTAIKRIIGYRKS